jgi:hypothetical protein
MPYVKGPLPETVVKTLCALTDREHLEQLMDAVIDASRLDGFCTHLRER